MCNTYSIYPDCIRCRSSRVSTSASSALLDASTRPTCSGWRRSTHPPPWSWLRAAIPKDSEIGVGREPHRRAGRPLPGCPPDLVRHSSPAQRQGRYRLPPQKGLVSGAEQASIQRPLCRCRLQPQPDGIAAAGQAVEHRLYPLLPAERRCVGIPGHHHTPGKQPVGGCQHIGQQGSASQRGQQLIAPEPPALPRGHHHAACTARGRSRSRQNTSGRAHSCRRKGRSCLRTAANSRLLPIRRRMAWQ